MKPNGKELDFFLLTPRINCYSEAFFRASDWLNPLISNHILLCIEFITTKLVMLLLLHVIFLTSKQRQKIMYSKIANRWRL